MRGRESPDWRLQRQWSGFQDHDTFRKSVSVTKQKCYAANYVCTFLYTSPKQKLISFHKWKGKDNAIFFNRA